MSFKVGQKVECIKDFLRIISPIYEENYMKNNNGWVPIKGNVYTIIGFADGFLELLDCKENTVFDPDKFRPLDYSFADKVIEMIKEDVLVDA